MEDPDKIVYWNYKGDSDSDGLPNGNGEMLYESRLRPMFKYVGEWAHGVRQGRGVIYWYAPHPELENSLDEHSWYSVGDYENARLTHPEHERGSYEPFSRLWDVLYDGFWENDLPLKKGKRKIKNGRIFTLTAEFNEHLRAEKEKERKREEEKQQMIKKMKTLLDEMEQNDRDMRMWKNVAFAQEFLDMLRKIHNATPLDKAEVCGMVLPHISEYDVPRYALNIAREQLQWLKSTREKSEIVSQESVQEYISRLEDYIDYENISNEEFMQKYDKHLNFDTIRRTPLWEENILRWEEECDKRLGDAPRGMVFCFGYWRTFAELLRQEGIEWKSPAQMNPGVLFD